MGSLTEDGVSMDVKAAVALLGEGPSIAFYLLPFQPTAEEIAKLQADDSMWLLSKPSPDPKKWKNGPYGRVKLGWSFEKESVGDAKKATFYLYTYSVGKEGSNMNINKFGEGVDVSLAGSVKEGQQVTLTSKGSDTLMKSTVAWDLKVTAKILALKKN